MINLEPKRVQLYLVGEARFTWVMWLTDCRPEWGYNLDKKELFTWGEVGVRIA